MSKIQRIRTFLLGLITIPLALLMMIFPAFGYPTILIALSLGLMIRGISELWFYFTMARHMVGGRRSLYTGMLVLDLGLFTWSLTDLPRFYILLYLVGIHMFAGLVDILAALDERKLGAAHWRLKLCGGLVNVGIGILCLLLIRSENIAIYIYCLGMLYNAVMRIVTAFRRTSLPALPQ